MFENLSDRLQDVVHKIKGYGKITEENISEMMREIRLSLLEADVNYKVVKEFTNNVKEKALGEEAYRIPVSSTKAYSGHLIAAAGSFETIVCLQAMSTGIMPATAHLTDPDPLCDLDYIAEGHRRGEIRRVLNLSFGFGGANAALVLEKHA